VIDAELSKRYGTREVLSGAKLRLRPGTVHALVGENGAGKSTLVKIIAGTVRGEGALRIVEQPVELARWDRTRARAAGIGIVQQHGSSAGTLSVVENAVLGVEPGWPLLALDGAREALHALGERVGLPIDPDARTDELSLGAAQRAEIVAALHVIEQARGRAKLLILDEPTAVLTPIEVEGLLATLRTLAAAGTTIVIVTHKLDEVRTVADDVTVLRAGKTVATFSTRDRPLEVAAIAKAMVGSELPGPERVPAPADSAPEALSIANLTVGCELREVALSIRRGELVGVAGVDGNGQRELALAIAGLVKSTGSVRIDGRDLSRASTARRLSAGLAYIPEDRHHGGLLMTGSVADNLALARTDITGRFLIDRTRVAQHAAAQITELDIRPPDPGAITQALSGGNQQKVVIARELSRPSLRAVIAAQPTRGVDLGAVVRIHGRLRAAATAGAGVLVISADLDELLALCHRIVVLLRGQIVGELAGEALRASTAREALGVMMTGAQT